MNSISSVDQIIEQEPWHSSWMGRRFYLCMSLILTAIVLVGFSQTLYLRAYFNSPPVSFFFIVHGMASSAWLALLVTQAALIRGHNIKIHRRLGIAGAVLAFAVVCLGVRAAIEGASNGTSGAILGIAPLTFLIIPLGQILIFAILVFIAIAKRNAPEIHKRLILIATINLIAPAAARIGHNIFGFRSPIFVFITVATLIATCIARDLIIQRKIHPAFAIAGPLTLVSFPLRLALAQTDVWMSLAQWMTN